MKTTCTLFLFTVLLGLPSSAAAATINGTAAPNVIFGGDGADLISGQGGADSLFGGAGDDHVCLGEIADGVCAPASQVDGNNPFGLGPGVVLLIGDVGGLSGSFDFDALDSRTTAASGVALHQLVNDGVVQTSLPGEVAPWNGDQWIFQEPSAHPVKIVYQFSNNGRRVFVGSDRVYGFDPATDSLMIGGFDGATEQGLLWSDCQGGALATWAGLQSGEGICFVGLEKGAPIAVNWKPRFPLAGEGEGLIGYAAEAAK